MSASPHAHTLVTANLPPSICQGCPCIFHTPLSVVVQPTLLKEHRVALAIVTISLNSIRCSNQIVTTTRYSPATMSMIIVLIGVLSLLLLTTGFPSTSLRLEGLESLSSAPQGWTQVSEHLLSLLENSSPTALVPTRVDFIEVCVADCAGESWRFRAACP